ncbi:MAG: 30S ribosomal protein S2 [Planctomycetota bacterium]
MGVVTAKEIIEAGVHFGHRSSRWHPKMAPYIFGKRNLIHIVDGRETIKGLVRASNFLTQIVASGKEIVFVGTKRQAKTLVGEEAQRSKMHWVSERWLGGTLTNFHTIRSRLKRLEELEGYEADGSILQYSKKRISALRRERRKILRNLEGLRQMKQLPGALVVVDVRREHIAVAEARKMKIPVVALVDTDCDPRLVDLVIPGNDDAFRSIQVVTKILADSIILGKKRYDTAQAEAAKARKEEEAAKAEARRAEQKAKQAEAKAKAEEAAKLEEAAKVAREAAAAKAAEGSSEGAAKEEAPAADTPKEGAGS